MMYRATVCWHDRLIVKFCAMLLLTAGTTSSSDDADSMGSGEETQHQLHVLLMASSTSSFNSSGAEGAVRLAMDRVNAKSTVLPGYLLELAAVRHTECNGPTAVRRFLDQVNLPSPTLIGVIGCGCSVATDSVADVVSVYGLPLISYTPVGVGDDIGHYQLFPSQTNFVDSVVTLVKTFGWRQLSILTQSEPPFIQVEQLLTEELLQSGITVLSSLRFATDQDPSKVQNIFVNTSRVFVANAFEDKARQLLCAFNRSKIEKARYAWILYGWYSDNWWKEMANVNCSEDELVAVLERALVVQQYPTTTATTTTTTTDAAAAVGGDSVIPSSFVGSLAYDSVWTLAHALNRTANRITSRHTVDCGAHPVPLEEFRYGNTSIACLMRHSLGETSFTGISGHVSFDDNGNRQQSVVRILQYRNVTARLSLIEFATVRVVPFRNSTLDYLEGENVSTVWKDGFPPHDGSQVTVISSFGLETIVLLYTLGILGLIVTTVCLLLNIIFRKRKVFHLTSPNMNYFILFGSYLIFVAPFIEIPFYSNDLQVWTVNCIVAQFTNHIGYSLIIGTILAKLCHTYYTYHDPEKTNKPKFSEWWMGGMICGAAGISALLVVVGTAIPVTRLNAQQTGVIEVLPEVINGTLHRFVSIDCWSQSSYALVAFLYIYLALLQAITFILALLNHRLTIVVFNDSKDITTIVYITTMIVAEVVLVAFFLGQYSHVRTKLIVGHMLAAAMVVNLMLFVPKVISLYKDPYGKNIIDSKSMIEPCGRNRLLSRLNSSVCIPTGSAKPSVQAAVTDSAGRPINEKPTNAKKDTKIQTATTEDDSTEGNCLKKRT